MGFDDLGGTSAPGEGLPGRTAEPARAPLEGPAGVLTVESTGPWLIFRDARPQPVPALDWRPRDARPLTPDLRRFRAPARRRLAALALAVAVVLGGPLLYSWARPAVASWLRGERDAWGNPRYEPPHRIPRAAVARIDMEQVNADLIPTWVIALGHSRRDGTRAEAAVAYGDLRIALGPDVNLITLFDELDTLLREDAFEGASRIDYLLWAYNQYLDRNGIPWRLEANLRMRRGRPPVLSTRTYRVLSDLRSVDDGRLRLVRRADGTNVTEGFLGHTPRRDEGALVMVDRVLDFAVHNLWPALHPGLDGRLDDMQRSFAPFVRAEAYAALTREQYKLLGETAVDQMALIEVAASIHARHACGSGFWVWGLPYNGLPLEDRLALRDGLERSVDAACPEVTRDEAARMIGASERLGVAAGLERGLEALATWAARGIALHELQHVTDGESIACEGGCPEDEETMAEVSAYLTSFASPEVGYAALLQACAQSLAGGAGPADRALTFIERRLLPAGCTGAPPADLHERAERLTSSLFVHRRRAVLPDAFPQAVPLLTRQDRPAYAGLP